jgi:hypothetical protein
MSDRPAPPRSATAPLRSIAAPYRIRSFWRAALSDLWRHRLATTLALLGAAAAAIAGRLAWRGAFAAFDSLAADRPTELVYAAQRALLILASGLASALLLAAVTRAAALSAYGGGRARDGLTLAPALLAISLLELLLLGTLAGAATLLLTRALYHSGSADPAALANARALRAACASALVGPLVPPALLAFAAARVAQSLVARGLPLGLALVHGCDFTLRRFPALVRLGLSALLITSPLLLAAALAPFPLDAPLLALASLWSYAALIRLVGADPRLAHG